MNISRLVAGAVAGFVLLAPNVAHGQPEAAAAEVVLLHAIPGVDMDVLVDGEVLIPGFAPGDMQDLSAFAGQTLVDLEVRIAETGQTALGPVAEFVVPDAGSWTIVAHLDETETPVITPFENESTTTPDDQGRFTLRHVAAAPAVDLLIGGETEAQGAVNGSSEHIDVPAGEITDAVMTDADGDEVAALPTFEIASGENLIVYAARSPFDDTFEFYVQERQVGAETPAQADDSTGDDAGDGTPAPTSVQTGGGLPTDGIDPLILLAAGFAAIAGMATVAGARARRSA
ncbi:MAG: DUF4397 domain-containing protein [Ilumatobacter sp.]|uniref:DUF4397 domain-containing protein n=1 Tax=Ilumatobacter sp. TaxID=1967498 RepID=UPI0032978A72